jgi:type I restriction enzyme S subunit
MTSVSKSSAFPKSVKAGIPKLGVRPAGWAREPLAKHLVENLRPVELRDNATYDLVTVKRSRGGVVKRERLKGADISVKSQFRVEAGDFLISKRQIVHGACGLVPPELAGSIVSNEYSILGAKPTIDLNFLNYLAHSIYFQQTCFHSSIGVHVEKMIFKLDQWLAWEFDLPPIGEQRRIAEILSTWDRAIETVDALIVNARAQKKALMQSLLTGKKRLPGFSGDWLYRPFGDIAEPVRTKVEPVGLPDDVRGIELEHIESETGRLLGTCRANAQASLKTPFSPANVLYGKLRPYLRKFLQPDFAGVCSTEIWVLAAKPEHSTPEFLHLLVQSPTFVSAIDVSSGSKMPRGDWGIVRDTIFAVPSLEEQEAISRIIRDADARAAAYETQLAALRQEKSALMQQLLTGKRRVKVDQREAA